VHSIDPVVKRPPLQHKGKRKSTARLSFGPGQLFADQDDTTSQDDTIPPKKSGLSRLAIERNAARHASADIPFRAGLESDRPSYSKDALRALQQSTPSTPQDSSPLASGDEPEDALDIKSKFGPLARFDDGSSSLIPTEAEIKEKKERRARLAKEQEYISLYGNESEDEERRRDLILRPEDKYPETRLVREDEDLAEGFDDFVEDERLALGKKTQRAQQRQKREEMASLIQDAQGGQSDEQSEDSEAERNEAYDAAQTRAGNYTQQRRDADRRPQTPPKITPIPDLDTVLGQLHEALNIMRDANEAKKRRVLEITEEKKQIAEQEAYIQAQLKETGEKYEKLRAEAGLAGIHSLGENGKVIVHRGLDSLGTTPQREHSSDEDDYY
jgi:Nineteen complex-related protein 2